MIRNEIKEMYEKNLKMLNGWLKDSVQKIDEQDLWRRVSIECNDEGYPVCLYHQGNKRFHITSNQPVREAELWYKANPDMEGSSAIFLFGSGFGYPIFEIFAHKMDHTLVVVFEEDIYLFKAMLYYFDLQPILQSGKCIFLVGDWNYFSQIFEHLFYSMFFVLSTCPAIAYTNAAKRNFKDQYIKIMRELFSRLCLIVLYIGNDHKDSMIGLKNIMENVREIIENPFISCLKDKYKGYPAFIIANGPSLDKNMQQLKDIQGRGLIICMESAIIPLLKNDIKPDILIVIERLKYTYLYHFKDIEYPDDIALLGLAIANPRVFPSFPGERIPILRDREFMNLWLSRYLGDGSVIDAGVNVSHLALEIAFYLGANPIVFVGQDYAYGADDLTHSKDSIYSEEKGRKSLEFIQSMPIIYLEGNNGTPIRSNKLWAEFKEGLELKISTHPERVFVNATEGGAKIDGAECKELKDAISQYCTHSIPFRVNELIHENKAKISVAIRKEDIKNLIENIESHIQTLRDAARELTVRKLECQKMLRLLKNNESGEYNQVLEEGYQNNIGSINRLIKKEMILCFSQQIVLANYYQINCLKRIDTEEKITEVFKIHYNFFCQLGVICQTVSIHFENALISLKNEFERIDSLKGCDEYNESL